MPADVCGFTTLESLDTFGSLDSLAFSLDDAVWSTACIKYGDGVVTTDGTASASPTVTISFSGTITGDADASASAGLIVTRTADIDTSASASAYPTKIIFFSGDIDATASVQALGGAEFQGFSFMVAQANAYVRGNAIFEFTGTVSSRADMSADLYIYGQEWTPVSTGSETWTQIG
jgi:hypothetical protein